MRRFLLVGALCAILGLTAAACKRPVPAPARHRHHHRLRRRRHRRRRPTPPPPPPPPAPLTEDQIFAKKTVDQLNAERRWRRPVRLRQATLRDDGRRPRRRTRTT